MYGTGFRRHVITSLFYVMAQRIGQGGRPIVQFGWWHYPRFVGNTVKRRFIWSHDIIQLNFVVPAGHPKNPKAIQIHGLFGL